MIDILNAWRWTAFVIIDTWLERMEYNRAIRHEREARSYNPDRYAGIAAANFRRWG